jgi:hypothetical protein
VNWDFLDLRMFHPSDSPQEAKPGESRHEETNGHHRDYPKPQVWIGLVLLLISIGWIGYAASWNLHRSHYHCEYYSDIPHYLGGAQGIAKLGAYRNPTTVGSPYVTIYPPIQSLFLSAFMLRPASIDHQLDAAAWGMSAIQCAAVLALFVVLKRERVNPVVGAMWCLLLATSPQWLNHTSKFMSDPIFSLLVFVASGKLLRLPDKPNVLFGILMGILGSTILLTRTAGIPFAFVIGLWSLAVFWRTRDLRWLAPGTILAVALGSWLLFIRNGYSYGNYVSDRLQAEGAVNYVLRTLLPQAFELLCLDDFAEAYFTAVYNWLSVQRWPAPWVLPILGLITVFLCLLGIRARRTESDYWSALAFGLYGLQVVIWPFPLGARCAMPLLPWIAVWSWEGFRAVTKSWPSLRFASPMVAALVLALVAANVRVSTSTAKHSLAHSSIRELDETIQWISSHASPKSAIASTTGIPRVQISDKLGRPLELFRHPSNEGTESKHSAATLESLAERTEWLLCSSEETLLPQDYTTLYPVVFSSGKWTVRRRTIASTGP